MEEIYIENVQNLRRRLVSLMENAMITIRSLLGSTILILGISFLSSSCRKTTDCNPLGNFFSVTNPIAFYIRADSFVLYRLDAEDDYPILRGDSLSCNKGNWIVHDTISNQDFELEATFNGNATFFRLLHQGVVLDTATLISPPAKQEINSIQVLPLGKKDANWVSIDTSGEVYISDQLNSNTPRLSAKLEPTVFREMTQYIEFESINQNYLKPAPDSENFQIRLYSNGKSKELVFEYWELPSSLISIVLYLEFVGYQDRSARSANLGDSALIPQ